MASGNPSSPALPPTGKRGQRAAVVAAARSWIGTPYHHAADVKGVGVDCAMLLVRVYSDLGLIDRSIRGPTPATGCCTATTSAISASCSPARAGRSAGPRRCRAVQDRALLRPWRHRDPHRPPRQTAGLSICHAFIRPARARGRVARSADSPTACARRSSRATGRRCSRGLPAASGQRPRLQALRHELASPQPERKPDTRP